MRMSSDSAFAPPAPPAGLTERMTWAFRPGWTYRTLIVILALWVVHSFSQAILAACVTAVASWPLYKRLGSLLPPRLRAAAPLMFTAWIVVFVLAPMTFAAAALLGEAHSLLLDLAAADEHGIGLPPWLEQLPLVGPWLIARYQSELAHPGTLLLWAQRTDPATVLGWAQSLAFFTAHHVFIITFTILLLFLLYQRGAALALGCRQLLRHTAGDGAERYIDLGVHAVRASVNSMLMVGLFNGLASGLGYALIGVPNALLWAAITGSLGLVPFLGYAAVLALTLQLVLKGATVAAMATVITGAAVLVIGDKVVRPLVAGRGVPLPFVWMLIGCLGGFETMGIVGLIIGPVVLALTRELWKQRLLDLATVAIPAAPSSASAAPDNPTAPGATQSVDVVPRQA